ncbi:MAG TPA: hypothetical protein VKZ51_12155, partial [Cyclobacteriaceae bacterium]|nr:hypothetical protein [Cyclobacteriaceae bacterium]
MPATSGEGATPPGLPVSLVHDSYKGEAPTEPGAVGRMGGILQQQTGEHLNHQGQTDNFRFPSRISREHEGSPVGTK